MKEITLYKNKGIVLVDDEDFAWLSQYHWHIDHGYASMTVKKPKPGVIYMHRLINKTPNDLETDHINGNKLDNRRINLRSCSSSQNKANILKRADNTSGHKGIVWHKRDQKWQAQICIDGKYKYLGQFSEFEQAVETYRRVSIQYFGEFANVHIR